MINFVEQYLNKNIYEVMNDDVKKKIKIRNSLKVNYGFKVGFTGNLGKNHVTPRGLTSNKLN